MSWNIRHEGSPQVVQGLTLPQVLEGLRDGLWEPTDEVMGPEDRQWLALENHPQLADTVLDLEPPLPKVHEDETRLDMNPLIDVALVLLIFFILTTSYEALHRILQMPPATVRDPTTGIRIMDQQTANQQMIMVEARLVGGQTVFRVDGKAVPGDDLRKTLVRIANQTGKSKVLFDGDKAITVQGFADVMSATSGTGITVHPKAELPAGK